MGSRDWSTGHNEPLWQTNTSFSPPLSRRWDERFHTEGPSYESQGDVGITLSSLSSNSKGSRSWMRGEQLAHHNYSSSDGAMSYVSSPSDIFQAPQLLPPVQGIHVNEYGSKTMRDPSTGPLPLPQFAEGTSRMPNGVGSTSCSDGSEYEAMSKIHVTAHRNFPSRSFMSKPVHPVSFLDQTRDVDEASGSVSMNSNRALVSEPHSSSGFLDPVNPQRETLRWSSGSSIDFTDVSDQMEPEFSGVSNNNMHDGSKCGLCDRPLSQRSPWSSRRIVRSGDMPIAGVLSCWHVYHADCLERITPKTCTHDPTCPLCEKTVESTRELGAVNRLKFGVPRIRSEGEEGQSRSWGCMQVGDCVEGALHASPRNSMLLNRGRLKRHLSLKGSPGKERIEKPKRTGMCSSHGSTGRKLVEQGAVGCSRAAPTSALKRW
uniref:RING finger protein 32 n=1 Tax=Anthurium amnicola TaxID=1678845 RepID=A0A1D1ZGB7_9ARAE